MFWFNYQDDVFKLNNKFSFEGNLLNRLLSEKYNGKKIKFLNIEFYDKENDRRLW